MIMKRFLKYAIVILVFVLLFPVADDAQTIKRQSSNKTTSKKVPSDIPNNSSNKTEQSKRASTNKTKKGAGKSVIKSSSNKSNQTSKAHRDRIISMAIDDMIWIEGGTFTMGATAEQGNEADNDERPAHKVTLRGFYICKFEVTQELWQAVMGQENPSHFYGNPKLPVENVSWYDCKNFIQKLNRLTGMSFRLPTEAEWEYAARGGSRSWYYKYSGGTTLSKVGWYDDNSDGSTHPVGTLSPNNLDLYDMSGNVWEWCNDWYGDYSSIPQTNPTGPSWKTNHVIRGGGWDDKYPGNCRVSNRYNESPSYSHYNLGFRLAASSL